ncbi:MAG TPA: response regulator transcription factor [Chloroflexia bacterium]|nr:response regulator transcription factor [Chloroflexia bacterium]
MNTTRILLVDDHALVREGFRALLVELGYQVVAEASDGNEALKLVELQRPNVVLMDIAMPELNGLEATAEITQNFPEVRVVILSVHADPEYARRALRAGAAGYLMKNSSSVELDIAIKAAMRGEMYLSPAIAKLIAANHVRQTSAEARPIERLTPRQLQVLRLIARGYSRKQIAEKLTISVKTFDTYRAKLMEQLDIHDVAGLMRYATEMGLVTPDE